MKLDPQSQTILVTVGGEVYGQRYRIEQGTALLSTPKTSEGGLDKMPSERRLRISEIWPKPERLYPFNETEAPSNKTLTSLALDPRRQVIYAIDPKNSQILKDLARQFLRTQQLETVPLWRSQYGTMEGCQGGLVRVHSARFLLVSILDRQKQCTDE